MDPARKRTIRLVVALSAAVLLATALIYTSFSASSEAKSPSQLLAASPTASETYQLVGKVADGSWKRHGVVNEFRVRDRTGTASVPVRYTGPVPDPFREGREIVVKVHRSGDSFVGERGTLVTKCPSKFATQAPPT
ncbi:MAG: cytochrome c-type biosis protein CcmE [Solirubrobacteraceae bacterium]|jgi:cytochrome c-type biogenesis protein CcmE|nr:cytochrome c-type biosis protein CcmE [Solirubrobacteraceae bacterium]